MYLYQTFIIWEISLDLLAVEDEQGQMVICG